MTQSKKMQKSFIFFLEIVTAGATQEFLVQSHDQNQTFPLGQTSLRHHKRVKRV